MRLLINTRTTAVMVGNPSQTHNCKFHLPHSRWLPFVRQMNKIGGKQVVQWPLYNYNPICMRYNTQWRTIITLFACPGAGPVYPDPPSAVISCRRINKSRGNYHHHRAAIIGHLGGDTVGGHLDGGQLFLPSDFAGVPLIGSLDPQRTPPFKRTPRRLFLSSGHSLRLV